MQTGKKTAGGAILWGLEQVRLVFNSVITLTVRTHKSRWAKVSQQEPPWDERNRIIGSLIPGESSVIDLGCGARTLKRYLKQGCTYQPCDVVQSAPEVLLCDFNAGKYPPVTKEYDYVVCSGVLEYIRDPADFLTRISGFGKKIILSYNPIFAGQTKLFRLGWNWVNHYRQEELEELFRDAGLAAKPLFTRPPNEVAYELEKTLAPGKPAGTGNPAPAPQAV